MYHKSSSNFRIEGPRCIRIICQNRKYREILGLVPKPVTGGTSGEFCYYNVCHTRPLGIFIYWNGGTFNGGSRGPKPTASTCKDRETCVLQNFDILCRWDFCRWYVVSLRANINIISGQEYSSRTMIPTSCSPQALRQILPLS